VIITLTAAQAAEITNTFWDITYTVDLPDGSTLDGVYSDDLVQEIPAAAVIIGQLALQQDGTFACEHTDLTAEDEVLIKMVLGWRATQMATIAALPAGDRPAARTTLRQTIRTQGRQDARRASRVAIRRSDRVAARVEARKALREDAVTAGLLPPK
jgi:hypothetical protein